MRTEAEINERISQLVADYKDENKDLLDYPNVVASIQKHLYQQILMLNWVLGYTGVSAIELSLAQTEQRIELERHLERIELEKRLEKEVIKNGSN